jgi:hypothetical protein
LFSSSLPVFENQAKQTDSKQTEKNQKKPEKPKFFEKIPKYAPYQTVSVGLLFVSVQSKHRSSLFCYRSETTKTNVLFRLFRIETIFDGHPNISETNTK